MDRADANNTLSVQRVTMRASKQSQDYVETLATDPLPSRKSTQILRSSNIFANEVLTKPGQSPSGVKNYFNGEVAA